MRLDKIDWGVFLTSHFAAMTLLDAERYEATRVTLALSLSRMRTQVDDASDAQEWNPDMRTAFADNLVSDYPDDPTPY